MVPHQQAGFVKGLQAQGACGGQEQAHQLHIRTGGSHPQQFHAALDLLVDALLTAVGLGAAKDVAVGPQS